MDWFERISNHPPSVGDFYEALLKSSIIEVLPAQMKIGAGFVYDVNTRLTSPQVDILIYDDSEIPVLYRRGEFVVISSESVISCIEVKKTLTLDLLEKVISKSINLNLGTSPGSISGVQFMHLFVFNCSVKIDSIKKRILKVISNYLNYFHTKTKGGDNVKFFCNHIVLPRVYFLDSNEYLESNYEIGPNYEIFVELSVFRSSTSGHSLGEFLSSVTSNINGPEIWSRNFLAFPLIEVIESHKIDIEMSLTKKYSIKELLDIFPNEENFINERNKMSKRPYGVLISSAIDLSKTTLLKLENSNKIFWLLV